MRIDSPLRRYGHIPLDAEREAQAEHLAFVGINIPLNSIMAMQVFERAAYLCRARSQVLMVAVDVYREENL